MKPKLVEIGRHPSPLMIWDMPTDHGRYSIGGDFAQHKQRDISSQRSSALLYRADSKRDFNCAIVFDVDRLMHVATMHHSGSSIEWTDMLAALGLFYNTALLVPELTGPGAASIADLIHVYRYPRIYVNRFSTKVDMMEGSEFGWNTSEQTRPILIRNIEEALTWQHHWTRDEALLDELRTMQRDKNGVARGMNSDKDDRVMALGMALQGAKDFSAMQETPQDTLQKKGDDRTLRAWEIARKVAEQYEKPHGTLLGRRPPVFRGPSRGRRFG